MWSSKSSENHTGRVIVSQPPIPSGSYGIISFLTPKSHHPLSNFNTKNTEVTVKLGRICVA